jgi:hypothetical protein
VTNSEATRLSSSDPRSTGRKTKPLAISNIKTLILGKSITFDKYDGKIGTIEGQCANNALYLGSQYNYFGLKSYEALKDATQQFLNHELLSGPSTYYRLIMKNL